MAGESLKHIVLFSHDTDAIVRFTHLYSSFFSVEIAVDEASFLLCLQQGSVVAVLVDVSVLELFNSCSVLNKSAKTIFFDYKSKSGIVSAGAIPAELVPAELVPANFAEKIYHIPDEEEQLFSFLMQELEPRKPAMDFRAVADVSAQSCSAAEFSEIRLFSGVSDKIALVKEKILIAAAHDFPVLIVGESGTGKSFAAQTIHSLSARKSKKWYDLNMASLSPSLAESELFGTVKGAFTDALARDGCFKSADGGTLFLDEIGDLSLEVQKKLLKVIETNEFRPVGSDSAIKSDVRIICATNADLQYKIAAKEFRDDLFYRIAQFVIEMPPLRERLEDIPILCRNYLMDNGYKKSLSYDAIQVLMSQSWQGNIRQLHTCLWNAVLLSEDSNLIKPEHLEPVFNSWHV